MEIKISLFILFIFAGHFLQGQDIGPEDRVISIYFGGGSYYIDGSQINELEDFFNEIDDLREYEVEIHGHTDNIGSIEFNQFLSRMRSQAILYEVLQLQVEREIISLHDFGELSPLYSNESWNGKFHNRRVDVILKKILL